MRTSGAYSVIPIFCLVILCLPGSIFGQVALDGFAARVNGTVILKSEVAVEVAVLNWTAPLLKSSNVNGLTRMAVLERLIDRELLLQQAHKFISQTITDTDVQQYSMDFDRQVGGVDVRNAFLDQHNISQEFWKLRIRNKILLKRYLEQRVEAFVRVSRTNVDEYLLENKTELGLDEMTAPLDEIDDEHELIRMISTLLELQMTNERKTQLLNDLRSAAKIVYCVDTSAPYWTENVDEPKPGKED